MQPDTARKYVQLAPKARRIPQHLIETWPTITPPVLDQISMKTSCTYITQRHWLIFTFHTGILLKRAKDGTALSRRDPRKRDEAEEVLNAIVQKLERHCARIKMPPQAKALDFDLNRLTERNERVYREVTTARHRKQLLEEQVEIASATLKTDENLTEKMKENAQQWRRRWKSQEKKQVRVLDFRCSAGCWGLS